MKARRKTSRTAFQQEGNKIFQAKRAAQFMLSRAAVERSAVMALARDEVRQLAQHLLEITDIAERDHLEKAQAGSLPPDVFPGPAE